MQEFKQLIEASSKILVTSHISPDPDAVCSAVLLGTALVQNFSDKTVTIALEEQPSQDLGFVSGYEKIQFGDLMAAVSETKPDLIVIVDANNFSRCSRKGGETIASYIVDNGVKTAIIDHHEPRDRFEADFYINQGSPACTQDVYEICFGHLGMLKPDGWAETTMLGIVADTARFHYENPRHEATFRVVDQLIEAGASVEQAEARLSSYSLGCMKTVGELIANTIIDNGMTYSYISDKFTDMLKAHDITKEDLKNGCDVFNNGYMRYIGGSQWGFIVYPEIGQLPKLYSVSFRSAAGIRDVSEVAARLGGGGHKPAAGAKIEASSVQAALNIVKAAL